MTYLSKQREPFQQMLDDPLIIIPMQLYQIMACVFRQEDFYNCISDTFLPRNQFIKPIETVADGQRTTADDARRLVTIATINSSSGDTNCGFFTHGY